MPGCRELTDAGWALLAPLVPDVPSKGEKLAGHRSVADVVLLRMRADTHSGEELIAGIDSTDAVECETRRHPDRPDVRYLVSFGWLVCTCSR